MLGRILDIIGKYFFVFLGVFSSAAQCPIRILWEDVAFDTDGAFEENWWKLFGNRSDQLCQLFSLLLVRND